jgi:hypothetical protein
VIFQFVRGKKAILDDRNMVFREGEPVYETDTGNIKIGDGINPYRMLEYFVPGFPVPDGVDVGSLLAHIQASEPHPVYDDGPSLLLLYQNAKV